MADDAVGETVRIRARDLTGEWWEANDILKHVSASSNEIASSLADRTH
jgi:hypothetical protein